MLSILFGFGWFDSWPVWSLSCWRLPFQPLNVSLFHHPTKVTKNLPRGIRFTTLTQHLGGQNLIEGITSFGLALVGLQLPGWESILPFGQFRVSNILTKFGRQIWRIISPKVSGTKNAGGLNLIFGYFGGRFSLKPFRYLKPFWWRELNHGDIHLGSIPQDARMTLHF